MCRREHKDLSVMQMSRGDMLLDGANIPNASDIGFIIRFSISYVN